MKETFCEGVYAQTKLDGEELIKATKCKFLIVRTSWVFGRFGKNFVKAIFNKAKTDGNLKVVLDELPNPTPAHALAQALSRMLKKSLSAHFNAYGIYHYAGSPALNRFEFAKRIVEISKELNLINSDVNIEPIKKADLNLKAKRPDDSRLDCQKTKEVFDIDMPDWSLYKGRLYAKNSKPYKLPISLSSCSAYLSDYERPSMPYVNSYAQAYKFTGNNIAKNYWQEFSDKKLDDLVNKALLNNFDLNKACLNVQKALIAVDISGTQRHPTANASLGVEASRALDYHQSMQKKTKMNVGLSYQIDLFGKIEALNQKTLQMYKATAYDSSYDAL